MAKNKKGFLAISAIFLILGIFLTYSGSPAVAVAPLFIGAFIGVKALTTKD